MQDLINKKIEAAAEFIRFQISQGIDRETAIQMMRDMSTLGPVAWSMVLELADDPNKMIIGSAGVSARPAQAND